MHEKTQGIRDSPVSDIMSEDFYTVTTTDSIMDVIEMFENQPYLPVFPVLDETGNFVGDIHERDLLKLAIDRKHLNEHELIGYMGTNIDESFFASDVKDIMEQHDVVAEPDDRVGDVVKEMWKDDLRAVPVVKEGEVMGVVYEKTVIDRVVEKLRESE